MLDGKPYLQGKIQFAFYLVALICFLVAAFVPAERAAFLRRINLVALGLALAIAPSAYIYFKVAFHTSPIFH